MALNNTAAAGSSNPDRVITVHGVSGQNNVTLYTVPEGRKFVGNWMSALNSFSTTLRINSNGNISTSANNIAGMPIYLGAGDSVTTINTAGGTLNGIESDV
jgi:hypothetical protein